MNHVATTPGAPDAPRGVPQPVSDPEAERLRQIIDRQPTCLLRIGMDGVILAANDAALGQLGARQLGQALNRRLAEWLPPDQRDRWNEFAGRVRTKGAASVECELRDPSGSQHFVRLQAVHQAGHPDGTDSMIVTIRDVSAVARLEKAVQEQESTRKALAETRARLEALMAERAMREAAFEQRQAWLDRESVRLETLLADTIRFADQARRLVQIAGGKAAALAAGPATDAKPDGTGSPEPEPPGDLGRTM